MNEIKITRGINNDLDKVVYGDICIGFDDLAKQMNLTRRGLISRIGRYRRGEIKADDVFKAYTPREDSHINLVIMELKENPNNKYSARQMATAIGIHQATACNCLTQLHREGKAYKDDRKKPVIYWFKTENPVVNKDYFYDYCRVMAKN